MKPGLKRFLTHLFLIFGVIVVVILLSQSWLKHFTRNGLSFTVPDFIGMNLAQAQKAARAHSLQLEVLDSIFLPNKPRGSVYRQIPEAGEKVKKNRRILVTINSVLPRKINAPSLVGFSLRQAKVELTSQNFQ
jgi:beta-lactam-binding protein with PASTA domain